MYTIGEIVSHCTHGLGTVQSVERKSIGGQEGRYSVLAFEKLTVMVNLERAEGVLRPPIGPTEAEQVLEYLGQPLAATQAPRFPSQVIQGQLAGMRSGDIYRLCDVVRALTVSARAKKLPPQQAEMLLGARARLLEELAYARHDTPEHLQEALDARLALV